jgi:glycosyltransferase involved in cell wall biosynthesis
VRVAAFVQGYAHGRGRATTSLEQISALGDRGHDVTVFLPSLRSFTFTPGVTVLPIGEFDPAARYDVAVFNSGLSVPMTKAVNSLNVPKLMCQHSYNTSDVGLKTADTVWYPSRACANADTRTGYRKFHCAPPINPTLYRVRLGNAIGAVSTARAKGGDLVAEIARRMPKRRFVVARDPAGNGTHLFAGLTNVEVIPFGDPAKFYGRCKILLFPSVTESYGRAPVEAAVSGIPTIATPLKAVKEALGGRGTFVPRHQVSLWVREAERMMRHPIVWAASSSQARKLGESLDYAAVRARWVSEVERLGR